jgi:hypothetical protein
VVETRSASDRHLADRWFAVGWGSGSLRGVGSVAGVPGQVRAFRGWLVERGAVRRALGCGNARNLIPDPRGFARRAFQIRSFPFDKRTQDRGCCVRRRPWVGFEFGVRRGIGGPRVLRETAGPRAVILRYRVWGVTGRPSWVGFPNHAGGGVFSWETPASLYFCPHLARSLPRHRAGWGFATGGMPQCPPDLRRVRRSLVPRGAIPRPRAGGLRAGDQENRGGSGRGAGQCSWPQPAVVVCARAGDGRSECSPAGRAISSSMTE